MDIKEVVRERVLSAVGDYDTDMDKLIDGIDEYIADNGFCGLAGKFDDAVIREVIYNNLASRLAGPKKEIFLFFSNYKLIENIRVINNRTLKLAKDSQHSERGAELSTIQEIERDFENCMQEVYQIEGLQDILRLQISEIILNIDYAKKASPYLSRRLRDTKDSEEFSDWRKSNDQTI